MAPTDDNETKKVRYVVVAANGALRRSRSHGPVLYDTQGKAQNKANRDGDSVVRVVVDLSVEPVFTRSKKLKVE